MLRFVTGLLALAAGLAAGGCPQTGQVAGETVDQPTDQTTDFVYWTGDATPSGATPSDDQGDDEPDEEPSDEPTNGLGDQAVVLEPDAFEDETVLNTVSALVTLTTALEDNVAGAFDVTANTDTGFEFAPTGEKVFGHANIPFFNHHRRLRIDFAQPVAGVSLLFAAGTFFETEIGRLEAYDADGNLLDSYVTQALEADESDEMIIRLDAAQIAWAVAYIADGEGNFGRLDRLAILVEP